MTGSRLPLTVLLVLGLVTGLLYAAITPPLQVPDEMMHFARIYSVSRGVCLAAADIDIPRSFAELDERFPHWLERHHRTSIADIRASWSTPLGDGEMAGNGRRRSLDGFINQNQYPCIPYVPAAISMAVGRRLALSPLQLMYLVRVTDLLVYLAITAWALRLLPVLRWSLVAVALMPMSLHQAASASADAVGIALVYLLVAYVLRLALGEPLVAISWRSVALGAALLAVVAVTRSLLAAAILPAALPLTRFGSVRRGWLVVVGGLALVILSVVAWQHVNRANVERLTEERATRPRVNLPVVDVTANVRYLAAHPLRITGVFARTLVDRVWLRDLIGQLVGRFGWLTVPLPQWLAVLYLTVMIVGASLADERPLDWRVRTVLLLFIVAGTATTLAVGWVFETPKAVVDGTVDWHTVRILTEGRYWIPLLFPALGVCAASRPLLTGRMHAALLVPLIILTSAVGLHSIVALYYGA